MAELIEREALRAEVERDQKDRVGKTDCAFEEGFACGLELALERIENAPAVAELVVHARWEHRPDKNEIVCAGEFGCYEPMRWLEYIKQEYFEDEMPPRCPHCGAKMDADRTE